MLGTGVLLLSYYGNWQSVLSCSTATFYVGVYTKLQSLLLDYFQYYQMCTTYYWAPKTTVTSESHKGLFRFKAPMTLALALVFRLGYIFYMHYCVSDQQLSEGLFFFEHFVPDRFLSFFKFFVCKPLNSDL